MLVLPKHSAAYFDIDDTLVLWGKPKDVPHDQLVFVQEPGPRGERVALVPHLSHIAQLKKFKESGNWHVVVWSQGGGDWAYAVIEALGLQNYVDVCMSKPTIYYDDIHCSDFMAVRRHHDQIPGLI